jgi:hypothetical protein
VGFGLRWSADIRLNGLLLDLDKGLVDTHLYSKQWPAEVDHDSSMEEIGFSSQDRGDGAWLRVLRVCQSKYILIRYGDGTDFLVDRTGSRIWCRWPPSFSFDYAATYLLGPVMGLVLRLRNFVCLHASVVSIANVAIAFVGPAGAGKSTLAATFAAQGFPVLADDILVLRETNGQIEAVPTYPSVRLWPESVSALFGSPSALPQISEGWDKRRLDLTAKEYTFETRPQTLDTIYLLEERVDDCSRGRIDVVKGMDAMCRLLANIYAYRVFDRGKQSHEFKVLSRLIRQVPIKSISPYADFDRIGDFCNLILYDLRRDGSAREPT